MGEEEKGELYTFSKPKRGKSILTLTDGNSPLIKGGEEDSVGKTGIFISQGRDAIRSTWGESPCTKEEKALLNFNMGGGGGGNVTRRSEMNLRRVEFLCRWPG